MRAAILATVVAFLVTGAIAADRPLTKKERAVAVKLAKECKAVGGCVLISHAHYDEVKKYIRALEEMVGECVAESTRERS